MTPVQVRRLKNSNDLSAFRALIAVFAEAFEDHDTYQGDPPDDDYITTWLATPSVIALVAEVGPKVAGGLVAYVLPKFEQRRSEIYIYDLAVTAGQRRRGIATSLIATLQDIAIEIGAWVVYVQADYADPPAIALYEKLGVREEVLHFDIPPSKK